MKNRILLPIQLDDEHNYNMSSLSENAEILVSIDKLFDSVKPSLKDIDFKDKNGKDVTMDVIEFKKLANFLVYGNEGIINRTPFLKQMKKEIMTLIEMENNAHKIEGIVEDKNMKQDFDQFIGGFIDQL